MRSERGFTLLEILVAAAIMGIAVAGVMSGLAASARNASRITQYDRAALLARTKMDELLLNEATPRNQIFTGTFQPLEAGGIQAGWQAQVVPFETIGTTISPGVTAVERVELQVWWMDGPIKRTFAVEGIRRAQIPADARL